MTSNFARHSTRVIAVISFAAMSSTVFAQQQQPPAGANPRRDMLEQRLRQRTGEVVQRRLQLTDDQMTKLQSSNRQFERQRSDLIARERQIRRDLRTQMQAEKPDQNRVSQLLDQTMQLERQRLDLVQSEQRELAKFMTPVQRAKLFAIQTELRRRTQELRNRPMKRGNLAPAGPLRFKQ
jgi:Spy/CpxP family protein refolding chaperone